MIELIREQPKGPLLARKWWRINGKYTVTAAYDDSKCSVTITDEENLSITQKAIGNITNVVFSVSQAPLGGDLIEVSDSDLDHLLRELESKLT